MSKLDEYLLNLIEKRAEGHSKIDYVKKKLNDLFCVCGGVEGIAYVINVVSKFKIDGMKLSLFKIDRIVFQSGITSLSSVASSSKQIDSKANFTIAGGFAIDLISDNCFFFIPLTAMHSYIMEQGILFNYKKIFSGFQKAIDFKS